MLKSKKDKSYKACKEYLDYAASYETLLLEQGAIGERGRGRMGFELPSL